MTTKTTELISTVESLPIDIKTALIERLLNSLHPFQKEIDKLWAKEAERRVSKIKTGNVKTIPEIKYLRKFIKSTANELLFPS